MTQATLWWLLAGGAVVAELLSGTFYLLMLGLGLAAAAVAAHAGLGLQGQILVAALTGGGAVVAWYFVKKRGKQMGEPINPANNLDVGEIVMVERWQPDGSTRIKYRGSDWTALHRPGEIPVAGPHRVAEVQGSRLLIEPLP